MLRAVFPSYCREQKVMKKVKSVQISKYMKCLYSRLAADTTCTDGADCVCALMALHSLLSKMITSACVLSWPPWLDGPQTRRFVLALRAILRSSWEFSKKNMLIHLAFLLHLRNFMMGISSATRPHFWSEDNGAKAALLCLRLARKLCTSACWFMLV